MELKIFYSVVLLLTLGTGLIIGGLYFIANPVPALTPTYTPVAVQLAPTPTPTPEPSTASILGVMASPTESFSLDKLYSLINANRRENHLSILKIHPLLEKSARDKLTDMSNRQYWTHQDPEGRPSWYLIETAGYHYEQAGENISTGLLTPWQVFSAWKASPAHDKELSEPAYEHMGAAVDCSTYKTAGETSCVVVLHLGKQLL